MWRGAWKALKSRPGPLWRPSPAECDGMQRSMQRNATLCNGLQHPHVEGATQLKDLQDFNATECNGLQRFATVSAKTSPALVGSKFQVQSSMLGSSDECDSKSSKAADSGLPHAARALTSLQPHPSPRVSLVAVWEQNDGMSHPMSHNVPQCPTMSHPNGPNGTSAPSDNDVSDNDLQDLMFQNVP